MHAHAQALIFQRKRYRFSKYIAWAAEWVIYVFTSVQYWNDDAIEDISGRDGP